MKIKMKSLVILSAAALPFIAGCDVDVEDKGKLPEVKVQGDSGQLPEYEMKQTQEGEMPELNVDAEPGRLPEVDVRGPDVDVGVEPVAVPVPDIDVDLPDENDNDSTRQ
jgi:hypothetical protein